MQKYFIYTKEEINYNKTMTMKLNIMYSAYLGNSSEIVLREIVSYWVVEVSTGSYDFS